MADSEVAVCNLGLLNIGDTRNFITTFDDPSDVAAVCKLIYAETRDDLLRGFKWPWATKHAYPPQLGGAAWSSATSYGSGAYVSYAPSAANVVNMPETVSTFVYYSIVANNLGNQPDSSPTKWVQLSRAAWAYAFLLPADYIKLQGIYSSRQGRNPRSDQQIPYKIEYEATHDANGNLVGPGAILLTDTTLPGQWPDINGSQGVSVELVYTARVTDTKQFPPDFTKALSWALAVQLATSLRKDDAVAKKAQDNAEKWLNVATANAKQEIQREPEPLPSWIAARLGRRRGR